MPDKTGNISLPASSSYDIDYEDSPLQSDLLSRIEKQLYLMDKKPQLLKESAGKDSCCIFKIPASLAEMNPTAYEPKLVSIGPYHHGKTHLQMIQEHKPRFLKLFLDKARKKGVETYVLLKAVQNLEDIVRISYSAELTQSSEELVSMMILDGCFILMLLLIVSRTIELDDIEDPVFTIPWILPAIQSDLLLLENQVPLVVLQSLLSKSMITFGDLNNMVFCFFNLSIYKPERYWVRYLDLKAKHLLDLIRMSFIPNMRSTGESEDLQVTKGKSRNISSSDFTLILSATRICLQGIMFSTMSDADSVLDIRLKRNKLQIPLLRLDGFISSIFLNCVAFEQFYAKSSNHITSYVVFMGCLLNGEEDATFLSDNNRIIENYFGNENEVSQFFKNICKDVVFDISQSYLRDVFVGVNEYTSNWYSQFKRRCHYRQVHVISNIIQLIAALLYFLSR